MIFKSNYFFCIHPIFETFKIVIYLFYIPFERKRKVMQGI